MTIIEALNEIKETGVKVSPFTNYDKITEVEYDENGLSFKPNEKEWPIYSIDITSVGNLNIKFEMAGILTEPDGTTHECKQYRQIAVVREITKIHEEMLRFTIAEAQVAEAQSEEQPEDEE